MNRNPDYDEELIRKYFSLIDLEEIKTREKMLPETIEKNKLLKQEKSNMKHFKTISELDEACGFPPPAHPLISFNILEGSSAFKKNLEIQCDFYIISLKKLKSGELYYGKTKYDHNTGLMYFTKPSQTIIAQGIKFAEKGFAIHLHQDFLLGHPLFSEIKKYNFFDYENHETLHLLPKEKEIMWSIYQKMESEYHNNRDEFSKSIILSHLDSLLKYAQRFYKRRE